MIVESRVPQSENPFECGARVALLRCREWYAKFVLEVVTREHVFRVDAEDEDGS